MSRHLQQALPTPSQLETSLNFPALLGPFSTRSSNPRTQAGRVVARTLALALLIASAPPAATARAQDDPLVTVKVFRGSLLDGNAGTALNLLAPDVLVYQGGDEQGSREDYIKHQIKTDIAHLAAYYVEEMTQTHVVQDDLAWVSTRLRLVGKSVEKPVEHFGTETLVLRRMVSGWLIVHRHWSDSALADEGD